VAQFVHREGFLLRPGVEQIFRRRAAQQIKDATDQDQGRPAGEELGAGEGLLFAAGQGQLVSKIYFAVDGFQARFQFGRMPVESDGVLGPGDLQPALVAPARQPLQKFQSCQNQRLPKPPGVGAGLGQPFDEFPIGK